MDRKQYDFAKKAGRTAYEEAIRFMADEGSGGIIGDVDQHRHPDYALLDHPHHDLSAQVEHNEDRINALEHELEALADTKETGEWIYKQDIRVAPGYFTLADADLTASTNTIILSEEDSNGNSHGFAGLEVGDYLEIYQEHKMRSETDYALYIVKEDRGGTGLRELVLDFYSGRGTAEEEERFLIKVFHTNDNLDLAELDERYALKEHTHTSVPSHTHNYASSSHSHNYAASNHTHSGSGGFVSLSHGNKAYYATNENWNSTTYYFPFYRGSSGSTYYGGRMDQLGKIEFKNGTNFYQKVGKTGTLIGATSNSHPHFPSVVLQVWETDSYSSTSNGTNVQRFYGTCIWSRYSKNWSELSDDGLYWYWRGSAK